MKVEIWSDIMCPFCYIGKRKFEAALAKFEGAKDIEIEWRSFQLDPSIQDGHGKNVYEYLAERKGIPLEQAIQMNEQVSHSALQVGLEYQMDKAVVANSFDAHRVIQLAKRKGLGDAMEERLFKAYFMEGKDFSDHEVLTQLGGEVGLDEREIKDIFASNAYMHEVSQDINEAQMLGVRGVPFFVLDRKYAVSGAQSSDTFLDALQKSHAEWRKEHPLVSLQEVGNGPACDVDGNCD